MQQQTQAPCTTQNATKIVEECLPVNCREPIVIYAGQMGHVDRFDKNVALMRIRLKRAMLRYHRVIFMWYICLVINNMMALMVFIFLEFAELQRSKEAQGLGYKHFFQNELGNQAIKHGLKLAAEFWNHRNAITVTTFIRFAVAKLRVAKIHAARKSLPRQSLVEYRG